MNWLGCPGFSWANRGRKKLFSRIFWEGEGFFGRFKGFPFLGSDISEALSLFDPEDGADSKEGGDKDAHGELLLPLGGRGFTLTEADPVEDARCGRDGLLVLTELDDVEKLLRRFRTGFLEDFLGFFLVVGRRRGRGGLSLLSSLLKRGDRIVEGFAFRF